MKKFIILSLTGVLFCGGCASTKLAGTFDGRTYTSPKKDYSVLIPVTDMGGHIAGDDERGVTFRDDMGMRVSFYSLQIADGSQMMSSLQTARRQKALEQFLKLLYHGVSSMNYHPNIKGGTISFIFSKDQGNKTSAAAFIHANRIYIVEFDLPAATKALWQGTEQEQNLWLEKRAVKLAQTIQTT